MAQTTATRSKHLEFKGPTFMEMAKKINDLLFRIQEERAPTSDTMAKAAWIIQNGSGQKAVKKLAKEARKAYSELEDINSPHRGESAYQNRMASLVSAIYLLIEEEETLQNGR